ncbi:MAG TPA: recombinase family protein [Trebonia sp.]|nr:recombinase family protein [Trebonia sp.]
MEENSQLRAIVAKRLSRFTEVTTHLVTETESIDEYVKRKNIKVWAEAEDLDVSGGKPIRERPKVGKLLSPEFLDEWDLLIIYKLDRGFRNHLDFVTFYHEYCERYGKKIVSVGEEGLDMSTPMGRMFAGILVQFAEWELQTIGERRRHGQNILRREARWGGGRYPFGYEPYQVGAYWYLRPHPVYAKEVERMARAAISGKSARSIALDLNERGIPTGRGVQGKQPEKTYFWKGAQVTRLLRSEQIRGYVMHYASENPATPVRVVGADGEFVRREPLIDDELWFKLQDALDASAHPKSGIRYGASLLLQVGFCGYCGGALHQAYADRRGKEYRYYRCQNIWDKHNRAQRRCSKLGSVQQDALNEAVSAKLLEVIGHYELTEKRLIEGDDHSATLKKLGMQIADLTTQHYVHNGVPDFHKRMQELEAEHERVSALPREKPKVRKIATGKTFRQHWEEMDDEQRHAYLKSAGVSVLVVRQEDYTISMPSGQGTQAADDLILDIPMNVVTEVADKFVVNIGLGTLREQLQHVAAV